MLEIKNMTKLYGINQGIDDFSLSLNKGNICAVVGHNGSGKSTLFKGILQLISVDQGQVILNNQKPNRLDFGYLPENRSVIVDLKTTQLIDLMAKLKNMESDQINEALNYWMDVLQCHNLKDKKLKECSKGNQQKIQMVCALIHDPQVIILDEPFSGLDIDSSRIFQKVIMLLKKKGKMVLLSSHRFDEIESLCDHIIVIKASKVILSAPLKELKSKTNHHTITLSNDEALFYKHEVGIEEVKIDGNLTHYIFKNEKHCIRVAKYMLGERQHRTLKITSLTLDDLYGGL